MAGTMLSQREICDVLGITHQHSFFGDIRNKHHGRFFEPIKRGKHKGGNNITAQYSIEEFCEFVAVDDRYAERRDQIINELIERYPAEEATIKRVMEETDPYKKEKDPDKIYVDRKELSKILGYTNFNSSYYMINKKWWRKFGKHAFRKTIKEKSGTKLVTKENLSEVYEFVLMDDRYEDSKKVEILRKLKEMIPGQSDYIEDLIIGIIGSDLSFLQSSPSYQLSGPCEIYQDNENTEDLLEHDFKESGMRDADELFNMILRARNGDSDAMSIIILEYAGHIRCRLGTYFPQGAESEDLEQEGMIGLYEAVRDFKPGNGSFKVFAKTCIEHKIISAVRNTTRQKHIPMNNYASLTTPFEDNGTRSFVDILEDKKIGDPIEASMRKHEMREILSQADLTQLEKDCFYYKHVEGLSYKEISVVLGRGERSITNALQRAVKKIERAREKIAVLV